MSDFVDGRRWPERAITPDPSVAPDAPAAPDSDQQAQPGANLTDLPPFEVQAIYAHGMVGLLFDPDHVPLLCAHPLFAASADQLHAAAVDIEQEIEHQILTARDRQITGGLR